MALENGNTSMYMPVAPAYNGGGFGGMGTDGWWVLLLLLFAGGGWGGFGGFGGGAWGMEGLYPWMNNSQNINNGFRDQMLNDNITSIRDGVTGISTQLCNGFAGVNAAVANGFAQSEIAANSRQMADMQQMFGIQSSLQNCCCENRQNIADLKYTIATEECATRSANTANTQAILDKLCQLELDNYKAQLEAKNDTISNLRSDLQFARGQASQVEQTAELRASQAQNLNNLVSELRSCPIPAQPVYGSQPIFTCGGNNSGCGCQGFYN